MPSRPRAKRKGRLFFLDPPLLFLFRIPPFRGIELTAQHSSYDAFALHYESLFPDYVAQMETWRGLLRSLFKVKGKRLHLLDICCGMGLQSICLAQEGHEVLGLDFSAGMLKEARSRAAALGLPTTFRQADCRQLSTALAGQNDFDGFVCGGSSILHFNARELEGVFRDLSASLKVGALGVIDMVDWSLIPDHETWTPRAHHRTEKGESLALEFYRRFPNRVLTSVVLLHRRFGQDWNVVTGEFCYYRHSLPELQASMERVGLQVFQQHESKKGIDCPQRVIIVEKKAK